MSGVVTVASSDKRRIYRIVALGVLAAAALAVIGAGVWNAGASPFTFIWHALVIFADIGAVLVISSLPMMMIGFIWQGRKH